LQSFSETGEGALVLQKKGAIRGLGGQRRAKLKGGSRSSKRGEGGGNLLHDVKKKKLRRLEGGGYRHTKKDPPRRSREIVKEKQRPIKGGKPIKKKNSQSSVKETYGALL